jgi:spore coat protein CotF
MNTEHCRQLTDKEQITDLLTSQKHMTCTYNTYCNETATQELRACMLSILRDEHTIGEELFDTMNKKGWYPVEKAEEQKISQAKSQFNQPATV